MEDIKFTDAAIKQLQNLQTQEQNSNSVILRLTVDGGGCSGFQYNFKIVSEHSDQDKVFTSNGATLVVDDLSYELVKGSQVDYVEELIGAAFVIRNPNASSSCGCGNSFSI